MTVSFARGGTDADSAAARRPPFSLQAVAYETRKGYQYSWCVDPLDGTKEFIKRNGQFTVNIGLVKGTSPLAGVVYVPAAEDGRVAAAPLFFVVFRAFASSSSS